MKFRYKVTACMIALIAVIFAVGGTLLLYVSFSSSMAREKNSATKSFNMFISTFSLMSQASTWTTTEDIAEDFDKLVKNNDFFHEVVLRKDDDILYRKNALMTIPDEMREDVTNGNVFYKVIHIENRHFIMLSSMLKVDSLDLGVDALYDITGVYGERQEQQKIYRIVFVVMVFCSAFFSYVLALFLTRPISRLKRTASRISNGNYELRSHIRSSDEIGELSDEFNRMADSLVDKMEELNAAMERQNAFIGNFTHELKTPMTSMIGYADLLRRQTLDADEQQDALNYIYSESRRLERLSIKMLDLIVAENKDQELALARPSGLICNVADHYRSSFMEKGIEILCDCEDGKCRLEPDYFTSLVINLIENARRAMEKGGLISIGLKMTDEGCILSVADNGCGIPEDKLSHLTDAFYRVDKARSRANGGAGLGLSLCDRIAKLHNGGLLIKSQVGVGTEVIVELKGGRA